MNDIAGDRVNITSYVQVLQTLGRFYLLPRLKFIYAARNEPQLLFFRSPELLAFYTKKNITWGRIDPVNHIQSFLDLLPSTSPKTRSLFLQSLLRERCLHAVKRMPGLKYLRMNAENQLSLSADFLTNFSSQQTLSWLHLRGKIRVPPPASGAFSVLNFHSLTLISFYSQHKTSITEYTTLFCVGKFPRLREMQICLLADHTLSPTEAWHDFFGHLRSATTNSLCRIDVNIKGPIPCQVAFEDISHLPTFTLNLFQTNLFHSLSPANLSMMYTRWPRLARLCIAGAVQVTIGPSSLVEIASHFPSLKMLEIQINCQIFPAIDDMPVLQHALNTLNLSPLNLTVKNHFALARCIDRTFPEVVALTISGSEQFLKSSAVQDIQDFYMGLQSSRMDQRMRDKILISGMSNQRSSP